MFFNLDKFKQRRKTVTLNDLKRVIRELLPNHIREFPKERWGRGPGTAWAVDRGGMNWYDPDKICDTFEEALIELVHGHGTQRPERELKAEIENQKLRAENESLKAQLLELKLQLKP